jgi:hypothetical protein
VDGAASVIGQKEIHGAHNVEAAGIAPIGARIAQIF